MTFHNPTYTVTVPNDLYNTTQAAFETQIKLHRACFESVTADKLLGYSAKLQNAFLESNTMDIQLSDEVCIQSLKVLMLVTNIHALQPDIQEVYRAAHNDLKAAIRAGMSKRHDSINGLTSFQAA